MKKKELVKNIVYDTKYTLSKLYKIISAIGPFALKEILGDLKFPSFNEFRSCVDNHHKFFSLADGILIVQAFIEKKEAELIEGDVNIKRIKKANSQSERMQHRDQAGLLGYSVARSTDPNQKQVKKVQSVWTVKKK